MGSSCAEVREPLSQSGTAMTKRVRASPWATQGLPEHLLEGIVTDLSDERRRRLFADLRQVCRQWRCDASRQVCSCIEELELVASHIATVVCW